MAFTRLKRFLFGGSDPHAERAAPDYGGRADRAHQGAAPDVSRPSDPPERLPNAGRVSPPPDARTDRGRGTGELGETDDPEKPLTD